MLRAIVGALIGLTMTGCGHTAGGVDIWEAVEQNDGAAIRKFKAAGGDVNVLGWDGSTPLWTALQEKKRNSFETLLNCGANPNVIMSGKRVVTHWAATKDDPWWLRLVLEHGADPNLINVGHGRPFEGPPLRFAIGLRGSLESVKLLLAHGAKIDIPLYDNCYPLASAFSQNKWDIVLYLLDQGADYNLAECGDTFLKHFHDLYQHKHVFLIKKDRDGLDKIHAWLKARGVEFGEN